MIIKSPGGNENRLDAGSGSVRKDEKEQLRDTIELTLVPGIGSVTQGRLRAAHQEISGVFSLAGNALASYGVAEDARSGIRTRRYRAAAEEILDWGLREGCLFVVRGTPGYPPLLEEIFDPPLLLYGRGNPEALALPCLAVVGTRRPTWYGLQMAEGLASDLTRRGVAIVSGLARGIDAAAHRGCLGADGRTIAVLGCGIDIVYPREHGDLSRRIERQGLLLSEFPPGTSPAPQNFPVRNRLISGLSLGALIVEAREYSGSLITARLALEQNREVFALPGNLTSPQSFGPNYLIKQGAKLVQSWQDIAEEFPNELRHTILAREVAREPRPALELLSPDEIRILDALRAETATHFDKILAATGLEISRLSNLLLNLEMSGFLRQVPGNLFVKTARPVV